MSPDEAPLVRVEHVSKKFCRSLKRSLWYGLRDLGGELAGTTGEDRLRLRKDEFLAVDDVSFELRRGECLGLIGANGAGKSTLLKMLNGLVRPDSGRIEIRGRVGALIELGAGFNPILTGRENVYVNGAVLGLSKKEIDARFDEIVAFAELAEFIDTPVQSYSSGMRVRLGFAVAAHLEPDVLLIDEVLAVGDIGFQAKCLRLISRVKQQRGVVFVSHDMRMISRICGRVLYLARGTERFLGPAFDAVENLRRDQKRLQPGDRFDSTELSITSVKLETAEHEISQSQPLAFVVEFECSEPVVDPIFNLALFRSDGVQCFGILSPTMGAFAPGSHCVIARLEPIMLMPGQYSITTAIWGEDRAHLHAVWHDAASITVVGSEATQGVFLPRTLWSTA